MASYTRVYNFTVKDALPTGNSGKVIKGAELDTELNAVASAISSKADTNSPTFTGVPLAPTASYGTSTTQLATTAFVQAALQALYPVGSIYINASSTTNPATLLGFGTWTAFGEGKVLVGQNTSDTDFDTLEETGGSKSSVASHTHAYSGNTGEAGSHSHTVNDPTHSHSYTVVSTVSGTISYGGGGPGIGGVGSTTGASGTGISINGVGDHSHSFSGTTASTGTSNGNLQPYVVCKIWKRTA